MSIWARAVPEAKCSPQLLARIRQFVATVVKSRDAVLWLEWVLLNAIEPAFVPKQVEKMSNLLPATHPIVVEFNNCLSQLGDCPFNEFRGLVAEELVASRARRGLPYTCVQHVVFENDDGALVLGEKNVDVLVVKKRLPDGTMRTEVTNPSVSLECKVCCWLWLKRKHPGASLECTSKLEFLKQTISAIEGMHVALVTLSGHKRQQESLKELAARGYSMIEIWGASEVGKRIFEKMA